MAIERFFDGLGEFAEFLERRAIEHVELVELTAALSAEIMLKKARAIFGDATKLAELAPSTQAERLAKGYSANEPLLRTGELLRDSVESGHEGMLSGIGSKEQVMFYHELGYKARDGSAVPPRPVLKEAGEESVPEIVELVKQTIGMTLGFRGGLNILEDE